MHRAAAVAAHVVGAAGTSRPAAPQADFGSADADDASAEPQPGVREEHQLVPTRDGVRMSCALTFPTEAGQGPWPVLLQFRYAGDGSAPRVAMADLAR